MNDVFVYESVTSETYQDLWVLHLGPNRLTLPYHLGFEILNAIWLACKMAMRYEGIASKHQAEFLKLDELPPLTTLPQPHRGFRRSRKLPNVREIDVAFEKQLVRLEIYPYQGEMLTAKVHYSDAFTIYRDGRRACKVAKRWAGDGSRIWSGRAHLADAEDNDKLRVE
jgi:hypothetical protein